MKKTIAYVGELDFPLGDTASTRVLSIGKIFRDLNFDVSFFCHHNFKSSQPVTGVYQGFDFEKKTTSNNKIIRLWEILRRGVDVVNLIKKSTKKSPDIIVYYGSSTRFLLPVFLFAKKNGIKLVVDLPEWYDYSHLPFGKYGPYALDVHYALTRLIPKCDGVIGISSYLTNYYLSKGVKGIRMPQLVDLQEAKWNFPESESFDSDSLNLIYAGVPGRKDLLGNAVRGLKILRQENHKVNIHLLGPALDDVRHCLDKDAQLVDELNGLGLFFHGRIPQEKIPEMLAKADFSILLRPDARYAHAGFPTKLVESFAAGLPVIANLTSDIGMYLTNNNNGIIAEDWSVNAFVTAVKKVCKMTTDELKIMKTNAKKTAIDGFDYRVYSNQMAKFLSEL